MSNRKNFRYQRTQEDNNYWSVNMVLSNSEQSRYLHVCNKEKTLLCSPDDEHINRNIR